METLMSLQEHLLMIFDFVTVNRIWEEDGVCTVEIVNKVMDTIICLNSDKVPLSVWVCGLGHNPSSHGYLKCVYPN